MMQVKALNLPLHTGMPTQAYGLVKVTVNDGGPSCYVGFAIGGFHVERWSLSNFKFVLLKGHYSSCKVTSGAAGLQLVK